MKQDFLKLAGLLSIFGVSACAAHNPTATTSSKVKGSSSIAGQIQYPAKVVPAMQVCASNTKTQVTHCVKTKAGQTQYLIKRLPAAEYYILASMEQTEFKVGGHMLQVQCIRAPCPALLNSVLVNARQAKTNIDLNGFYLEREDFPKQPTAKKP